MIEREAIGRRGFIVLIVLLVLRMPVGLAMVAVGIGGNFALSLAVPFLRFEPYLEQFKTLTWGVMASYELSVVPLFILMGFLASYANLSRDLFRGLNGLVGRVRGGVAMAAVGACAGFGAVCGSSLATASTMGRVALPELAAQGYAPRLATGTLAAGGTLGILIPPSIALVIYAVIVEASVIAMFQAALVPGILAVIVFLAVIAVRVARNPSLAPPPQALPPAERRAAPLRLIPVAAIFGTIIAGLGLGLFTPTPAAAVGATIILLYGLVLRLRGPDQGLGLRGLKNALLETALTSGMIYIIIFGADLLKPFISRTGLPAALAGWASMSGLDPWLILVAMLVILIVLGCMMESLSLVLVMVPFFWPVLADLNGGDFISASNAAFGMTSFELKLWFGILALVVVELGLITPPVGLNVFIISAIAKAPMRDVFLGVLPFFAAELGRVALILAFPALALAVPRFLSG